MPALIAERMPSGETLATDGSEDSHESSFREAVFPPASRATAESGVELPTWIGVAGASMAMDAIVLEAIAGGPGVDGSST